MMRTNNNKQWSYEDIANVLRAHDLNISSKHIAESNNRSVGSVQTLISNFNSFKTGKVENIPSLSWRKYFQRYTSNNGQVAQALRAEVRKESSKVDSNTTNSESERLLQSVEDSWKKTLEAISALVKYEADRRATEATASVQKELFDLRKFKETAQEGNIAGTLRKTLMSFKQ